LIAFARTRREPRRRQTRIRRWPLERPELAGGSRSRERKMSEKLPDDADAFDEQVEWLLVQLLCDGARGVLARRALRLGGLWERPRALLAQRAERLSDALNHGDSQVALGMAALHLVGSVGRLGLMGLVVGLRAELVGAREEARSRLLGCEPLTARLERFGLSTDSEDLRGELCEAIREWEKASADAAPPCNTSSEAPNAPAAPSHVLEVRADGSLVLDGEEMVFTNGKGTLQAKPLTTRNRLGRALQDLARAGEAALSIGDRRKLEQALRENAAADILLKGGGAQPVRLACPDRLKPA